MAFGEVGRPPGEKLITRAAWAVHGWGVRPNHLSFLQVPLLAGLVWAGYTAHLAWFATLQFLIILVDGADGTLARRTFTVTRQGHLLDSIFDIVGIALTLWAVGHIHPRYSDLAFGLLFLNFVVYIQNEIQGTKSVTYTRGPATVGLILEPWTAGILQVALLIPVGTGLFMLFSRLNWRRRVWNWYQFLTSGRRREYKALPRGERHEAADLGGPPRPQASRDRRDAPPREPQRRGPR